MKERMHTNFDLIATTEAFANMLKFAKTAEDVCDNWDKVSKHVEKIDFGLLVRGVQDYERMCKAFKRIE